MSWELVSFFVANVIFSKFYATASLFVPANRDPACRSFMNGYWFEHFHSVAYTADEVQYKWLSGSTPVGLEGDLQMSQFDLQQTFARELNFTRSESGWENDNSTSSKLLNFCSWFLFCPASCVPAATSYWIFSNSGIWISLVQFWQSSYANGKLLILIYCRFIFLVPWLLSFLGLDSG